MGIARCAFDPSSAIQFACAFDVPFGEINGPSVPGSPSILESGLDHTYFAPGMKGHPARHLHWAVWAI